LDRKTERQALTFIAYESKITIAIIAVLVAVADSAAVCDERRRAEQKKQGSQCGPHPLGINNTPLPNTIVGLIGLL